MRKYLIGWLFIASFMIIGVGGSSAQTGIRILVVNEFLNIRLRPAIGATVIDTVDAGYVFDIVTARSGDDQWVRVDYLCEEGWINLTPTIVLEGDISTLPTADPRSVPAGGFEAPRAGFTNAVGTISGRATNGVRIRSGPSTGYPTIGNILFNQSFTMTGRNRCGSWVQVSFEGTLGWISATFVQQVGSGNLLDLPEGGIVADTAAPQVDGDDEYFATLRLMLDRLNLAQPSLDDIRGRWTDAALQGRAICQEYPPRPSNFNIPVPLLAANYGVLNPLQTDFNNAMTGVREAIDLFIQVCNQPGTGNPVGQATVQGALNILNESDQLFAMLRQRLNELIPDLTPGGNECLLVFNRSVEILPQIQFGTIYGDSISRRTYARGYCFEGIEGQLINLQVLPIPPSELKLFLAISSFDNPTDFIAVNGGTPGVLQTVGPITLPRTGTYLLIVADLQEDFDERVSFGDYAILLSDLTFSPTFPQLGYDTATNSIILTEQMNTGLGTGTATEVAPAVCPNLAFTCSQLFTCEEAAACLQQGNFNLDVNGDGIACNEPGNLLLNTSACTLAPPPSTSP